MNLCPLRAFDIYVSESACCKSGCVGVFLVSNKREFLIRARSVVHFINLTPLATIYFGCIYFKRQHALLTITSFIQYRDDEKCINK